MEVDEDIKLQTLIQSFAYIKLLKFIQISRIPIFHIHIPDMNNPQKMDEILKLDNEDKLMQLGSIQEIYY